MGIVCVFSHNTSLGGRRQKPIGALNSPWIRGEAKPNFGSFLVKFGLSIAVLECFGPFRTSSERFRLFRGRLNWASRAISG